MERFLKRHQDCIAGVLSGFDRVLFRGTLRSISYLKGMEVFLSSQQVLYKDFRPFAERLSGDLKERAKRIAERTGRPFVYLESSRISKEEYARGIMVRDGVQQGLICVLSCVEPCRTFSVRRDPEVQKLRLVSQERKCLHLYFYYVDRDLGFMHVRLQTWLPFPIQVCINGREWLARRLDRAGIGYERRDNCFARLDDVDRAQRLFDGLIQRKWGRVLDALARRIIPEVYPQAKLNLRGYYWTIREDEYATDVMFTTEAALQAIYPRLIDHAIQRFDSRDVLRFLGRRINLRFNGEVQTTFQRRPEGVRIKHWVEENSIKMYDKQGCVLRIETTINNPRRFKVRRTATRQGRSTRGWIPLRKGIADISRRVQIARAANERYLEALAVVGESSPTDRLLDPVSQRRIRDGRPYRPLHPIGREDSALFRVVLRGEFLLQGFRNQDLRRYLAPESESDPLRCRQASGRISRLLRLLRAHGLIRKVSKTHYYRVTQKGQQVMTTALKLREIDVSMLVA